MPVYLKRGRTSEYTLVTAKLENVVSSHALFESYDERGVRMIATRGRVAGEHCESTAAKITVEKAGIKFDLIPCVTFIAAGKAVIKDIILSNTDKGNTRITPKIYTSRFSNPELKSGKYTVVGIVRV